MSRSRSKRSSTTSEIDPKEGFEIAFKQFPESQMAQLYSQRKDGRFCDATITCSDGEFKAHRCILATLCARDLAKPLAISEKVDAVRRFVNLCYTGYLKVNVENLEQDIKVAKALECEFVLNAVQKWVTENVKEITGSEKTLKDIDFDIVKGCIGRIKYMNEIWQDFLTQWAGSNADRKKDIASLQPKIDKCTFVSIYRCVVVGGKVMKYDGNSVVEENWQILQNDKIIIIDSKNKKRVNISREGTMSFQIADKVKMTHSLKAMGICESVRPIILWLSDGSLIKVVDKPDPFEDLNPEDKEVYVGPCWKKPPFENACADLYLIPEHGAVIHYPGHGTSFLSQRSSQGFQQWLPMPCSDIHHAYSDGKRILLVSRDVNTYTVVSSETFQTLSTVIRGGPRQSPFVIPTFCQGDSITVAIVDLEKMPKTFYFVQYENGRSKVLSESFDSISDTQFSVM